MPLFIVRHAKAGSREKWDGDDRHRPLNAAGRAQAEALAEWLSAALDGMASADPPPRLDSSPYVRCIATLEPLTERLGLKVEPEDRLAEGAPLDETLALLDEVSDASILCSHGDVIADVVAALERRGMRIEGAPDWRKAATWVVERGNDGTYRSARAVPPPAV